MPHLTDVLLLGLVIFLAVRGWRRGFVCSLLGVGRLIVAVLLTMALFSPVAGMLSERLPNPLSGIIASLLAIATVFLVAYFVLSLGLRLLAKAIHSIPIVSGIDRICGLGLGALAGVAAASLVAYVAAFVLSAVGQSAWVEGSFLLRLFSSVS